MKDNNASCLLLKYSWNCCVEYDSMRHGHNWNNIDKGKWVLLKSEISAPHKNYINNEKQSLPSKNRGVPLTKYGALVNKLLINLKHEINKKTHDALINSPLLIWFQKDSADTAICSKDLSMVLNTIARERTFKPFEIMTSVCGEHVTINIRGLPIYTPSWIYFSKTQVEKYLAEFLLCMGEEAEEYLRQNKIVDLLEKFRFIRVLHKFMPLEVMNNREENKFRVMLHVDTKVIDYMHGRVCGCLPIPGSSPELGRLETCLSEPEAVKSPEIVVQSPVISKDLEKLSGIWQDTFARAVLISAPPGSGKEELSKSIPYGNGRPTEKFQTISMADCDAMALQQRLYGTEKNSSIYVPGLIALAKGSALFLDEIHHPGHDSPARANLLRTLEAGEYFAIDAIRPRRVEGVLFIMATSKRLKELKKYNPPDFWTRMTHAIEIKHPLDFASEAQKLYVLSKFFNHFWWMRIEGFYGMRPVFGYPPEEMRMDPSMLVVFWQVHSMTQIMGYKCKTDNDPSLIPIDKKSEKHKNYPFLFAEVFLKECSSIRSKQALANFSIRGIRSMVTRLFSIAASTVAQGQPPWHEHNSFENDVSKIFKEILRIACVNQ